MKTITNIHIDSLNVKTISEIATSVIKDEKSLSVKLDKEQHKKLKILAFNLETTMSEIVRAFLVQFVEQYRKEKVIEDNEDGQD